MSEFDLGRLDLHRLAFLPGMTPAAFARLTGRFADPTAAFSASRDTLIHELDLPRELAEEILARGDDREEMVEMLRVFDSAGIEVLWNNDAGGRSPRLEEGPAWHFLTLLGDPDLLDASRIVGMVGRRNASEQGLQFAHDLAAALADHETPTLSGMARGIDRAAHLGSLSVGGATLAVTPEGILRFLRNQTDFAPTPHSDNSSTLLVISGAPPQGRWSVGEAMRRNRWIASWCDALVVVEANPDGGTWTTAEFAARRGKPVWVCSGFEEGVEGLGNSKLAEMYRGRSLDVGMEAEEAARLVLGE